MVNNSYFSIMSRKNEILKPSVGIDYIQYEQSPIS
jgi:hypothetical protein